MIITGLPKTDPSKTVECWRPGRQLQVENREATTWYYQEGFLPDKRK